MLAGRIIKAGSESFDVLQQRRAIPPETMRDGKDSQDTVTAVHGVYSVKRVV